MRGRGTNSGSNFAFENPRCRCDGESELKTEIPDNIVAASDLESAMTSVSEYITAKESEPIRSNVIPLVRKAG
jgi:hypothetical protein